MSTIDFAFALFSALAAIPKLYGFFRDIAAGVALWYINSSNEDTLREIADAAALAARAQNHEERVAALSRWRSALARPRILS